jgi:hypothetical protein
MSAQFNPDAPCCPLYPEHVGIAAALHGWQPYQIDILIYREGSPLAGPHQRMVNPAYLRGMLADKNLRLVKLP